VGHHATKQKLILFIHVGRYLSWALHHTDVISSVATQFVVVLVNVEVDDDVVVEVEVDVVVDVDEVVVVVVVFEQ